MEQEAIYLKENFDVPKTFWHLIPTAFRKKKKQR